MRRLLVALMLALPSLLTAQAPTDSALVRRIRQDLDSIARDRTAPAYSKRAQTRLRARADSVLANAIDTVRVVQRDTAVVVKSDTAKPAPVDTTPPVVVVTPGTTPGPILFTHPFGPPANGAVLATLPQDTVDVSYPAVSRVVRCSNLQACLDTAKTGDEIRLAPGASFTDVVVRPTGRTGWVVVRTDVTDAQLGGPWDRMTVSRAASLNLATIRSSGSATAAITFASGSHHVFVEGVRVTTSAASTNALVRIGLGETDPAQLPTAITLRHVVVDPGANDLRRCVVFDGARLALISSSLVNCHSNAGDSQGLLSINGRGPFRIENNTIQGGHQSVFFGGGDPGIRGQVPSDIVVRRNDLSRPLAWKGVWQTKTSVEQKIGKRVLYEGNVICHTWADAQSGYAVLLKSENQDGGAWGDWSESSDITFRYNRICGAAGGINLAPLPNGPGVPMARVTLYGNEADSIGVGPFTGDVGDALLLQGVSDVVFRDNWTRNPTGRACMYSVGVSARFVFTGNVCGGQYGIRGEGGLGYTAPGSIITGNNQVPWGTAFGSWPATPSDATRAALLSGVVVTP